MNIALVTYQDQGAYHQADLQNEDDLLIDFLKSKAFNVEKAVWNDLTVVWENFDLVILKSPWDYFNLIDDFYEWLDRMATKNIRVLNPLSTIKWNSDKHYLQDISQKGLNVTPSMFLVKGNEISLETYFHQFNTEKIIVKPAVSGGSKHTFKVTRNDIESIEEKLIPLVAEETFIVQPFLTAIEDEGEWSFVFFGGEFSHALLKKAQPGDFRVQSAFGGSVHPQIPEKELLATAQTYIDHFAKDCLYARVDGTIVDGQFLLMELELIEPFLFLDTAPNSLNNYYQALKKLTYNDQF